MPPADSPHRKTCRRYDVPGHAHYLTFSCFHRQPFLSGQLAPGWLADAVEQARSKVGFDLWAFVFMPEHVHMLIHPRPGVKISQILWAIKSPVGELAIAHVRRHRPAFLARMADRQSSGRCAHRFWQRGGGYDRNLFSVDEVVEKIEYIHANPVRRGLVARPGEWQWSSWRAWHESVEQPLRLDRESLRRW